MGGQFDNETTSKNYEWHRERILREKKKGNKYSDNRVDWNVREIRKKHGDQAAREIIREFKSK